MAKYLYSDLKYDKYKSYHHVKKISIARHVVSDILGLKDEYLQLCSRILFYTLEYENITFLTIQKKCYLENNYFFDCHASLRELRSILGRLKKQHKKNLNAIANKKVVKAGKKGVYILLSLEHQKKLEIALKGNKMTLTALFINFLDSIQPTTKT